MMRRHDRYILRSFVAALVATILFLSSLVVIYDVADRLDKLPKVARAVTRDGGNGLAVVFEYYLTLLPFLWMRSMPLAVLIAAGATFTWLGRQNELVPLVASGVPTRRVLRPVFFAAIVLALLQTVARETVVPELSRRHDDLHRLFRDQGRADRLQEVPHIQDTGGGRLSMAAYFPRERRMESAWITFRRAPDADGHDVLLGYPVLAWDATRSAWVAERGGQRRVLRERETGADAQRVAPGEVAPLEVSPSLLDLSLRKQAALGLSSAEIAQLAKASPDRVRLTLLLHQQWSQPLATVILLLLGMPFFFHLGRRGLLHRSFGWILALVGAYYVTDGIVSDMGSRGALNPIVAAWGSHVVFGALGIALMSGVET